jgi:hypothetical protein
MKITIESDSQSRTYEAVQSDAYKEATKTKEEARFLFTQILIGKDDIVAMNGTTFTRNKKNRKR